MVLQILFLGPSNLLEPKASFAQMSQKLIVSPIVKTLVFSKVPEKVSHLLPSSILHNYFIRFILYVGVWLVMKFKKERKIKECVGMSMVIKT
uniref:Uncharacterized protein n=1 Tax=Solanum tuberosum TaxID=4113 RepID=M1D707_SOLTU